MDKTITKPTGIKEVSNYLIESKCPNCGVNDNFEMKFLHNGEAKKHNERRFCCNCETEFFLEIELTGGMLRCY